MNAQLKQRQGLYILAAILLLFMQVLPLHAEVSRVYSRALQGNTYNLNTIRYAEIDAGTIIDKKIVTLSIVNKEDNETDSTTIKVELEIAWDTEAWGEGFFKGYFTDELVGNTTFRFNNTEISNYISVFAVEDYDIGGITGSVNTLEDFTRLDLPEGTYWMNLYVYEVDEEGNEDEKGSTESVPLKIVHVGDIGISRLPEVNDMSLEWNLPEIPMYSDIATSSVSVLHISGLDVDEEIRVYHDQPSAASEVMGGEDLKGYPSGNYLSDSGVCTYPLGLNHPELSFRAGNTYSVEIDYQDWTGTTVSSLSRSFSFPEASPNLRSPENSVTDVSDLTFTWSFDAYADWISSYDLVLEEQSSGDEIRISGIKSSPYTLERDLSYGEEYTWYVVPYYESDGNPFYTDEPADAKNFRTPSHDQLDVSIEYPVDNAVLFVGDEYEFSGNAVLYDDAEIASAEWSIDGRSFNGKDISYAPEERDEDLEVIFTVRDNLGLSRSASMTAEVLDQKIAAAPSAESLELGKTYTFELSDEQDIDTVHWYVNGDRKSSGSSYAFTPETAGTYEVYASGESQGVSPEGTALIKATDTETAVIEVYDPKSPEVSIQFPEDGSTVLVGESYALTGSTEFYNEETAVRWIIDGSEFDSAIWEPEKEQTVKLVLEAEDSRGNVGTDTVTVNTVDPKLNVTEPSSGDVLMLGSLLDPQAEYSQFFPGISWTISDDEGNTDNLSSPASYRMNTVGEFTLEAEGEVTVLLPDGSYSEYSASDSVTVRVVDSDPPVMTYMFPESDSRYLIDGEYTFTAEGSSRNGISAFEWNINGSLNEGASISFDADERGDYSVQLTIIDNEGLKTESDVVTVSVIDPEIVWEESPAAMYTAGVEANFAVKSQDTDPASISWFINGKQIEETGLNCSYVCTDIGDMTVEAVSEVSWVDSDGNPSVKRVSSGTAAFEVISGDAPEITGYFPQQNMKLFAGTDYQFSFTAESANNALAETITVDGAEKPGSDYSFTPSSAADSVTIKFTARDELNREPSVQSVVCEIIDPEIAIENPEEGKTYPINTIIELNALTRDIGEESVLWYLDGEEISSPDRMSLSSSGSYTLSVSGKAVGTGSDGNQLVKEYSDQIALTAIDEKPPRISFSFPKNGYKLFSGSDYSFSASAETNNSLVSQKWIIEGAESEGASFDYTAAGRHPENNPLILRFEAEDNMNLFSYEEISVTVLQPELSLAALPPSSVSDQDAVYFTGQSLEFSLDPEKTQDVSYFEWYVNGELVSSGSERSFTYSSASVESAEISVLGFSSAYNENGEYLQLQKAQDSAAVKIIENSPPQLSVTFPYSRARLLSGESYVFSAAASSGNGTAEVSWYADGEKVSGDEVFSYTFNEPGAHTLSCRAEDPFGLKSEEISRSIQVMDPELTITVPADEQKLPYGSTVNPSAEVMNGAAELTDTGSLSWIVNGEELSGKAFTTDREGMNEITAVFSYEAVNPADLEISDVEISSSSSFEVLRQLDPPSVEISGPSKRYPLLLGEEYLFTLKYTADSSSEEESAVWNLNGTPEEGLEVSFTPENRTDEFTVDVTLSDSNGLQDEDEAVFRVIDPSMEVVRPSAYSLLALESDILIEIDHRDIDDFSNLRIYADGRETEILSVQQGTGSIQAAVSGGSVGIGKDIMLHAEVPQQIAGRDEGVRDITVSSQEAPVSVRAEEGAPSYAWSFEAGEVFYCQPSVPIESSVQISDSPNPLREVRWTLTGSSGRTDTFSGNAASGDSDYAFSFAETGSYELTCQVYDIFGRVTGERSAEFRVIDPSVNFTMKPGTIFVYYETAELNDYIEYKDLDDIRFYFDDELLDSDLIVFNEPGTHLLRVEGRSDRNLLGTDGDKLWSDEIQITVEQAERPEIILQNQLDKQIWRTGEIRELSVQVRSDNTIETVLWDLGEKRSFGEQITYTVPSDYSGKELPITITATDEYGISSEQTFSVQVINPSIGISRELDGSEIPGGKNAEIGSMNVRDIDAVSWYVNGEVSGFSLDGLTLSDPEPGTYSIYGEAEYSYTDDSGSRIHDSITTDTVNFIVYDDKQPEVTDIFPSDGSTLFIRESFIFTAEAESSNGEPTLHWQIDGISSEGKERGYYASQSGDLEISLYAEDDYSQKSSVLEVTADVVNPKLSITSYDNGDEVNIYSAPSFSADTVDIDPESVVWYIDGREIDTESFTAFPSVGMYEIRAEASVAGYAGSGNLDTRIYSDSAAIEVFDSTPPSVAPAANYDQEVLIAGQPCTFFVEAESAYPIDTIEWDIGGEVKYGAYMEYIPEERGELPVSVKVRDERGGMTEMSWLAEVKDPSIYIASPAEDNTVYEYGGDITVRAADNGDVDSVRWYLDGTAYQEGREISLSGLGIGRHILQAEAYSRGLGVNGAAAEKRVKSIQRIFYVTSFSSPEISGTVPGNQNFVILKGKPYTFSFTSQSENGIDNEYITIQGDRTEANSTVYVPDSRGSLAVTYRSEDVFYDIFFSIFGSSSSLGKSIIQRHETQRTVSGTVYDPVITITYPEEGTAVPSGEAIDLKFFSQDIESHYWEVNGNPLYGDTFTPPESGEYTLKLKANISTSFSNASAGAADGENYSYSDTVTVTAYDSTPPAVIFDGPEESYVIAGDEAVIPASVESENTISSIQWSVNGAAAGKDAEELAYTFREAGEYSVTCTAEDEFGIASSASMIIKAVRPSLRIISPGYNEIWNNKEIELKAEADELEGFDKGSFVWMMDGEVIGSADPDKKFSYYYTFGQSYGRHDFQLQGDYVYVNPEGERITKTVSSFTKNLLSKYAADPLVGFSEDYSAYPLLAGRTYSLSCEAETLNSIEKVEWFDEDERMISSSWTAKLSPETWGSMRVTVKVTDEYGLTGTDTILLDVSQPDIDIISFEEGDVVHVNENLDLSFDQSVFFDEVSWYSDGQEIFGNETAFSEPKTYTIAVEGLTTVYTSGWKPEAYIVRDLKKIRAIESDPPEISIEFPGSGMDLTANETYSFLASAESEHEIHETWWEINGKTYTGSRIDFSASMERNRREYEAVFHALDEYGAEGIETLKFSVSDPFIELKKPLNGQLITFGDPLAVSADSMGIEPESLKVFIDDAETVIPVNTSNNDSGLRSPGMHTIQLRGFSETIGPDGNISRKEIVSEKYSIDAVDKKAPVISILRADKSTEAELDELILSGSRNDIIVRASTTNDSVTTVAELDGEAVPIKERTAVSAPNGEEQIVTVFSLSTGKSGNYHLALSAADEHGHKTQLPLSIRVKNPLVRIDEGNIPARLSLESKIDIPLAANSVDEIIWFAGEAETELPIQFSEVGQHLISVEGKSEINYPESRELSVSDEISVEVIDSKPPGIEILNPADGDTLFFDEVYMISGSEESEYDITSREWFINSRKIHEGSSQLELNVSRLGFADPAEPIELMYRVENEFGITAEASVTLEVINPSLEVVKPVDDAIFALNSRAELEAKANDVENLLWKLDGEPVAYADRTSLLIPESGRYELSLTASAEGLNSDFEMEVRTYADQSVPMTVKDPQKPRMETVYPLSLAKCIVNEESSFKIAVETGNDIAKTIWQAGGSAEEFEGLQDSYTFLPRPGITGSGNISHLDITCSVVDEFGSENSLKFPVEIVNPELSIIRPRNNAKIPNNEFLELEAEAAFSDKVSWYYDGEKIDSDETMMDQLGEQTLTVEAEWPIIRDSAEMGVHRVSKDIFVDVIDAEPPVITIAYPEKDNSILMAGETYQFSADAESSSGIADMWWVIDGERYESVNGRAAYVPAKTSYGRQLRAEFHAVNEDGAEGDKSIHFSVKDPQANIAMNESVSRQPFFTGETIDVRSFSRDLERVWLVDGSASELSSESITLDFSIPGMHRFQLKGITEALSPSGRNKEYEILSNMIEFPVYSDGPVRITDAKPDLGKVILIENDSHIDLSVSAESDNGIDSVIWGLYRGTSLYSSQKIDEKIGSDTFYTLNPDMTSSGNLYSVTAYVYDGAPGNYARRGSVRWTVKTVAPEIHINFPKNGEIYSETLDRDFDVSTEDLSDLAYYVDGESADADFSIDKLKPGIHQLEVRGVYFTTGSQGTNVKREYTKKVQFQIKRTVAPEIEIRGVDNNDTLILNTPYKISIDVLNDREIRETEWYFNSQHVGSGESFDFAPSLRGRGELVCRIIDEYGLTSEESVSLRVVSPTVTIRNYKPTLTDSMPLNLYSYSRDTDSADWMIDADLYSGSIFERMMEPGEHEIELTGRTYARMESGRNGIYEVRDNKTVNIFEQLRADAVVLDKEAFYTNSPVTATLKVSGSKDTFNYAEWYLNGELLSRRNDIRDTVLNVSFQDSGSYYLKAVVYDRYGNSDSATREISIYHPIDVSITYPGEDGMVPANRDFSAFAEISQSGEGVSEDAIEKIEWYVDGAKIAAENNALSVPGLEPGRHEIEIRVYDALGTIEYDVNAINSENAFGMQIDADEELIEGFPEMISAVIKPIVSDLNSAEVFTNIEWMVGESIAAQGQSFTFDYPEGSYTVQAVYEGEYGRILSPEYSIKVRAYISPSIVSPVNGSVIKLTPDENSIILQAQGEDRASYTWYADNQQLGKGKTYEYYPESYGDKTIKLVAEYQGREETRKIELRLEDASPLAGAESEQPSEDAEPARSADGTDEQAPELTLSILQPEASGSTYVGTLNLEAQLEAEGRTELQEDGSYSWNIQDVNGRFEPIERTGRTASAVADIPGDYEFRCTFEHPDLSNPVSSVQIITLQEKTEAFIDIQLNSSVYLPQETLDFAFDAADSADNEIEIDEIVWYLDGIQVGTNALKAPPISGLHELRGELIISGITAAEAVSQFRTNIAPTAEIRQPASGQRFTTLEQILASCSVHDDQEIPDSRILWTLNGAEIGNGRNPVIGPLQPGENILAVSVTDPYGAVSDKQNADLIDKIQLIGYDPFVLSYVKVNKGFTQFMKGDSPLNAEASYSGGINPSAEWNLIQGETVETFNGKTVSIPSDVLREGNALIHMRILDDGREVYSGITEVTVITEAAAEIMQPADYQKYPLGSPAVFTLRGVGFSKPDVSAKVEGEEVPIEAMLTETDEGLEISCEIGGEHFTSPGAKKIMLTLSEGDITRSAEVFVQILEDPLLLELTEIPQLIDLNNHESGLYLAAAKVSGAAEENITWLSNQLLEPLGTGPSVDLGSSGLKKGYHWITAQVPYEGGEIYEKGFQTTVTGDMEIIMQPDPDSADDVHEIDPESADTVSVQIFDKDGQPLSPERISWTSDIAGSLGTGSSLNFGLIRDGEMHTVSAEGRSAFGGNIIESIKVTVSEAAEETDETETADEPAGEEQEMLTDGDDEEESGTDDAESQAEELSEEYEDAEPAFTEASDINQITSEEEPEQEELEAAAVVTAISGRCYAEFNGERTRLSFGDDLYSGSSLEISRNASMNVFFVDGTYSVEVYDERGTYEWNDFSETWEK